MLRLPSHRVAFRPRKGKFEAMFLSIPAAGPPLSVVKTITELLYKPFASKASLTFLKEKIKIRDFKVFCFAWNFGNRKTFVWNRKTGFSGGKRSMERTFLLEVFQKIWNTFRSIPLFSFDRNDRKFLYHLLFNFTLFPRSLMKHSVVSGNKIEWNSPFHWKVFKRC